MYVCLCHAVTERDIRAALAEGVRTLEELAALTGCGTGCGCCRELARSLIGEEAATSLAPVRLTCAV